MRFFTGEETWKEINAEFLRLMAVPLEDMFFAQLDIHSSQLIRVIRAKGGSTRQKTADIMDILDQDSLPPPLDTEPCTSAAAAAVRFILFKRMNRGK
ncbi:unnamed protein product [Boreogadus saida]